MQKAIYIQLYLSITFALVIAILPLTSTADTNTTDWHDTVIADFEHLYLPMALENGLILAFDKEPNNLLATASADNNGVRARVGIAQGLITSPRGTHDGFIFTICHELGHIFGGAPRRTLPLDWDGASAPDGYSLLSAEGQADYYANTVCFRKMVQGQNHKEYIDSKKITPRLLKSCNQSWGENTEDSLICQRAALGGDNLMNLVIDFPISFETPDNNKVTKTIISMYPDRQCRLDTILAGALCKKEFPLRLDPDDETLANCPEAEAARPACWYLKPEK